MMQSLHELSLKYLLQSLRFLDYVKPRSTCFLLHTSWGEEKHVILVVSVDEITSDNGKGIGE